LSEEYIQYLCSVRDRRIRTAWCRKKYKTKREKKERKKGRRKIRKKNQGAYKLFSS
jgi:hypothetical protein